MQRASIHVVRLQPLHKLFIHPLRNVVMETVSSGRQDFESRLWPAFGSSLHELGHRAIQRCYLIPLSPQQQYRPAHSVKDCLRPWTRWPGDHRHKGFQGALRLCSCTTCLQVMHIRHMASHIKAKQGRQPASSPCNCKPLQTHRSLLQAVVICILLRSQVVHRRQLRVLHEVSDLRACG